MSIIKRSVTISGHATSITLEQEFWDVLKDIAANRQLSVNALIAEIDSLKKNDNLSSAIRIYILQTLLARL